MWDNRNDSYKSEILENIKAIILSRCCKTDTFNPPEIKSLFLARNDRPRLPCHCLEQPIAALGIQGNKIITIGQREFNISPGKLLVNCVDVPGNYVLLDASPQHPMLSIYFLLDKQIITELASEARFPYPHAEYASFTCAVMEASTDIMEGFLRLARLADRPKDAPVLSPLVIRELHYYLLASPMGGILRDLFMKGAKDGRILQAITWLKQNLDRAVSMNLLAKSANMSISSLHRHFKEITGFSPLQYHKRLRLCEAQRLMLTENERADSAAQAVGYESVTQFNREYKRLFGEPPRRDINKRKKNLA